MANWPAYSAGSARVTLRPRLADGFKSQVKTLVKPINEQIKVQIRPELAPRFRTDLRNLVRTASAGVNATVGVRVDARTVRSQVRAATTGMSAARLALDLDFTRAVSQLETFRAQVAAQPLSLNVDADTSRAVAQLMALRTLATSVSHQIDGLGNGGLGRSSRRLTGNIFTRPVRAIRLQVEIDRASVARAEAEVANVAERLSRARQIQSDATDRVTLAETRLREVTARSTATDSQRIAATQALARARGRLADAQGRVLGLMNDEFEANRRLTGARDNQNSIGRLVGAGWAGFSSALADGARNMLSFRNLTNLAMIGLVALAAVSLVPLIGQLSQAAGVIALFPAGLTAAVSVFAALKISLTGISDTFKAAEKASDSAVDDAEARGKAVASAQKQVASAARGVTSAEKSVRSAQKSSIQAQKDLNKARKQAKDDIDDLNRALGRTVLTEQAAAIAVAEAQRELWQTFTDPESDAIDRARAKNSLDTAIADQRDLLVDNQRLAEQAADANAKGVEGSDAVVSAKERVTEAAESELEAQQALVEAQTALVEAQQQVTDAMNESSSAAKEFEKQFGKLSPVAQDFVQKWLDLKPELSDFRKFLQETFFMDLGGATTGLTRDWLPTLREGLGGITYEINAGLLRAIQDLNTEATRSKLATLFENVELSIGPLVDGVDDILQGFLSLSQVGSEFLPGLSTGFGDFAQRFRDWAESPQGQQKFRDFLRESLDTFGKIWNIGVRLIGLVRNIFRGSDETGESWIDSISKTLDEWNTYLSSEEGQQKIRDFFRDVRETVGAIVDLLIQVGKLVDKIDGSPLAELVDGLFGDENEDGSKKTGWDRTKQIGGALIGSSPIGFWGGAALDQAKKEWSSFTDEWLPQQTGKVGTWAVTTWSDFKTKASDAFGSVLTSAVTFGGLLGDDTLPSIKSKIGLFIGDMGVKLSEGEGFWGLFGTNLGDITDGILGEDGPIEKLKAGFGKLGPFFDSVVITFGAILDRLPASFQGPINAVIDVLNGFGDVWNKLADKLGLPKWDPIGNIGTVGQLGKSDNKQAVPIGGRWMGGPGGPVRGPGGPKEDKAGLYALSAGEHIWTADEVAAAGGHQAMYDMRRAVLGTGGKQSRTANFAIGGGVEFGSESDAWMAQVIQEAFSNATVTSAFRPGHSGFHGKGQAIDIDGPKQQIANWIFGAYPESSQLIYGPGPLLYNVGGNAYDPSNQAALAGVYANDLAGHFDHVHWANAFPLGNLSDEEKQGLLDRVRSMAGSALGAGRDFAVDSLVRKPLAALVNRVPEFPELGEFGRAPRAFVQKMADEITSFISSRLGSSDGGLIDYDPAGGVERWRDMAKEAMRRTGFNADDENQVNAMLAQIKSESGGNPSILQQVQDVNSGGNEAKGLLQVIPGTFAAHRDPSLPNDRTDPMANMVAALNYYKSRYGNDLTTTWGHGHGYAQGGWVNGPGGPLADKIRALLSNGEFVVKAGAAGQWGPLLEAINGGLKPQAKTLEQPINPAAGIDPSAPQNGFGQAVNPWVGLTPGVDTWQMLGDKTKDRFKGAFETGFNDLVSSTLGPLGLPDPRTLIPSEVTSYAQGIPSWLEAKQRAAQATSALQQSGYYQAGQHAVGTANTVMSSGPAGQLVSNDYSTVINLYPRDTDEAYRKAEQIRELRAIQHK